MKVTIEYPKDWAKEKFFQNGAEVEVSKEVAEQFIELGIVKVEKTKEEEK